MVVVTHRNTDVFDQQALCYYDKNQQQCTHTKHKKNDYSTILRSRLSISTRKLYTSSKGQQPYPWSDLQHN